MAEVAFTAKVIYAERRPWRLAFREELCGVLKVQVSDPALTGDLVAFLRRVGCVADVEGEGIVLVSIPRSLREDAGRLELDVYLRTWEATRPGARAARVV
jgi:hypothetical protein